MSDMTRGEIIRSLKRIRRALDRTTEGREQLRAEQLALYEEGKGVVTYKEMADASGVGESMVAFTLHKARRRADEDETAAG